MKVFLVKVLIVKKSQKLCYVQFSLCWLAPRGIDMLFEKLTSEQKTYTGMNLRNTLFALICLCGLGFHGKPVAWGQVNRKRLKETMYVALS